MSAVGGGDYLPPVIAELIGNADQFNDMINHAMSELAEFSQMDPEAHLGGDITPLQQKLIQARSMLDLISVTENMAKIGADDTDLKAKVTAAIGMLSALERMTPEVKIKADVSIPSTIAAGAASSAVGGLTAGAVSGGLMSLLWGGGARGLPGMLGFGTGMAGFGSLGMFAGFGPEHALMTLLGLGGNLAGGMAGGGLLGAGALATSAVGMGTDLAGMGQAAGDIKQVYQAQQALNQAIAEYGKNSTQAADAQRKLNFVMTSFSPIAQQAVLAAATGAGQLRAQFDAATGQAEKLGAEIILQLEHVAGGFIPTIGKYAAQNMSIIQSSMQPLMHWISTQGLADFKVLEQKFSSDLPTAVHMFSQGLEFLINTLTYLSQYTGGFIVTLDKFFTKMNTPLEFSKWEGEIQILIGDFENWKKLIDNLVKDIYLLFHQDVGTAGSIVQSLDQMLIKLGQWEQSTRGSQAIQSIFLVHKQEILELLQLLPSLVSGFGSVYLTIAPTMVSLVNAILPVINAFAHNPFGAWILAIGLILSRMSLLGPALTGVGMLAQAAATRMGLMSAATAAVGTEVGVATGAEGVAGLGFGLEALTGPVGIAVGALTIGLGGALLMLMHRGPSTAQQISTGFQQMAQQLSSIPTDSIIQFQSKLDTINRDIADIVVNMNHLKTGSEAFNVASGKLDALRTSEIQTLQAMTVMNGNVQALGKAFGISNQDVINFAQEAGINLQKSLDPTQVQIMGEAIQASGQNFNKAATLVPNFANSVVANSARIIANVQSTNSTWTNDMKQAMALNRVIMDNGGLLAIAGFINTMSGGFTQFQALANNNLIHVPSSYMSILEKNMATGGKISVNGLIQAMAATAAAEGPKALSGMVGQFGSTVTQIQNYMFTEGTHIGAMLDAGVAAGLMAQASQIGAAAQIAAAQAIKIMHLTSGTRSPSTVTYQLGLMIMEGLRLGLVDGTRGAVTAAAFAAAAVTAAINAKATATAGLIPGGVAGLGTTVYLHQNNTFQIPSSGPSNLVGAQVKSNLDTANADLLQTLRSL